MLSMKDHLSTIGSRGRITVIIHRSITHLLTLNRSVVGRLLNNSSWPTILMTDTAATTRVGKRVVLFSFFSSVGMILWAVVSIITPLGLYENHSHSSYEEVEFGYAPDLQSIGRGTPPRTDYNVSRLCGSVPLIDCPGQNQGFNFSGDYDPDHYYSNDKAWISSAVPTNITKIFSSGSHGNRNLVASAFDIEYRSFVQAANSTFQQELRGLEIDQGRKRTQALFRMYESLITKDQVNIVDGLIVDTKVGGIGFRNHTVPIDPGEGSEWTEGLLWIQPETVCVSTNMSIEYTITVSVGENNAFLMDRGGFSGLAIDPPLINFNDTQTRPELFARAHKGATCNNSNLMKLMGISKNKTAIGTLYPLESGGFQWHHRINIASFGLPPMTWGMLPGLDFENSESQSFSVANDSLCDPGGYWWFDASDLAYIGNITFGAGLMLGTARRSDGNSDRLDPGSKWSAPIYSCATALKAHIMDVSFRINGTNSLTNLQVASMKPRIYSSNASLPLWAVEDTGMIIEDVAPFWGVVDDKYESRPHLWTLRRDSLYLPAGAGSFAWDLKTNSASASAQAPQAVLKAVYKDQNSDVELPDYSGFQNYPLYLKWQELSQSSDTASTIVNLIWTDIMANYVLGTKSTLNADDRFVDSSEGAKGPMIRVLQSRRKVEYDLRYGILGIVFLAFYLMAILLALTFWVTGRVHFEYLRTLLNQTATGRCVTVERHGDAARAPAVGTRKWIQVYGEEDLGFRKRSAEKRDSDSERGASQSPPSTPEDDELLPIVEGPLEQEQTAHQDVSVGSAAVNEHYFRDGINVERSSIHERESE